MPYAHGRFGKEKKIFDKDDKIRNLPCVTENSWQAMC